MHPTEVKPQFLVYVTLRETSYQTSRITMPTREALATLLSSLALAPEVSKLIVEEIV